MRSVSHSLFLSVVTLVSLLISSFSYTISSTRSVRITDNESIVSAGGVFELGLFKSATKFEEKYRWYLGIRYKGLKFRAIWVANREKPLNNSVGILQVANSNIVLLDQFGSRVWTTNQTKQISNGVGLVAELLDNGNFVLRYSNNFPYLWQSFDFPTDTLLPGMKLGWDRRTNLNRVLTSWKSSNDPSKGDFIYKIELRKLPEGFIFDKDLPIYRSGPWNKVTLSGISTVTQVSPYASINITVNDDQITYGFDIINNILHSVLLRMNENGLLEWWVLTPTARDWKLSYKLPTDQCDKYSECGPNSYCDLTKSLTCNCFQGFKPRYQAAWDLKDVKNGCVRVTQLSCVEDKHGFLILRNTKLPDTKNTIVDTKVGFEECRKRCLENCTCVAFANTDMRNGGSGCVMWTGNLVDVRNYNTETGQDIYVKLADRDLPSDGDHKKTSITIILVSIIGGLTLAILVPVCYCFLKRKFSSITKIPPMPPNGTVIMEDWGSSLIEYDVIATATNNFADANTLGQGGFGTVYKGQLPDGQEIAVKKLTDMSQSGLEGFENEMKLIARVQHSNLIRLVGFCSTAVHKLLVYEYIENSNATRRYVLNWEKRFEIIKGIVRGLIYLHQDSRFRIIHLDLKPGNILLDSDMIPKISDFGLAKLLGGDATEGYDSRVVGTFARVYIDPGYKNHCVYSAKSDVFSFGVLLLEIVSGKRNIEFLKKFDGTSLLTYIWDSWSNGEGLEIVDPVLKDSSLSRLQAEEILRCVQIGLLCVHEFPEDRPTMNLVGSLLEKEVSLIDQPKCPSEIGWREPKGEASTSTVPQISFSMDAR